AGIARQPVVDDLFLFLHECASGSRHSVTPPTPPPRARRLRACRHGPAPRMLRAMDRPPLRWYFDFISPFACLQWPKVRALMAAEPVVPVPVVLGAVLGAVGQKGPAEIPGKRVFTYRHALWRARMRGVELRFPPAHPF